MTLEEVQARHREVLDELVEILSTDVEEFWSRRAHLLLIELSELNRKEVAMLETPGFFCGSNFCDDPACQQDHAELL